MTQTFKSAGPTPFKWVHPSTIPTRAELLSQGHAYGYRGYDGRFERDPKGECWLAFAEPDDLVYWHPQSDRIATYHGRAFALGELTISNAATYALDDSLKIFGSVPQWVAANGKGIFIIDWSQAFDKLREASRIECDDDKVAALYRQHMRPKRMPIMKVRRQQRSPVE